MNNGTLARIAAGLGFLAVALGAFGAHGLKDVLVRHDATAIWQTAVFYHLTHAVLLYILASRPVARMGPSVAILVGIAIFSGSLYILALTGIKWLGAITPIGGVSFLVGWAWLAICPGKRNEH